MAKSILVIIPRVTGSEAQLQASEPVTRAPEAKPTAITSHRAVTSGISIINHTLPSTIRAVISTLAGTL